MDLSLCQAITKAEGIQTAVVGHNPVFVPGSGFNPAGAVQIVGSSAVALRVPSDSGSASSCLKFEVH